MFRNRLNQIRKKLLEEKLDAVFISSVFNIEYLSGYSNFSRDEREAYILIGGNFQYIITDGRYSEAIKKQTPHLTLFERSHKTPTEKLFKILKNEQVLSFGNKIKILGIEEDNLTVAEFKKIKKYFKNTKHFNAEHLRSIKNAEELDKIKKACRLGDLAFKFILKKIKSGVSEKEIAGKLEKFIKDQGAELSFPSIVAFGKNSSIPHHQTGNTKLKKGDIVLLDFGVKFENYCSDMTRTVFFGIPSKKQKEIYKTVLDAQQKAIEFLDKQIKSGKKIKASDVDKVAREYIKSKGFSDIPHSLGHGIGLEVHEHPSLSPKSRDILKEGMVFSIEPGIYLPAGRQGIPNFGSPRSTRVEAGGVRIEDLFVLGKDGLKQITHSPKVIY